MDFLSVCTPEGETFRQEIGPQSLRIGRASGNDLILRDLNVSRLHAEVVRRADGCYLLDAGGKNGTFVNDQRISGPTLLRNGDRIRLGSTLLVFNGAITHPVEFSDRPLPLGAGTTFLRAAAVGTPALSDLQLVLQRTPAGYAPTPPGAAAAAATPALAAAQRRDAALTAALGIIFEADQELVFHRPLPEILETIMDLAGRAAPFERGLLMLLEGERLVPRVVRVPPAEAGQKISVSRTIADRVVHQQESVLTSDALFDERFRQGQSIEAQGIRSVMCVPLWNNKEVIGLIYVDSRQRSGLFTEENLRVLTHLANVAAVKIENARLFEQAVAAERMEQELRRAAEIQNHLLPAGGPTIPGYLLDGSSVPCQAVGGDYYDYIELPGGRYGIGLGDVAGKGLPAALLMCSFQASLRALSELDLPPEETIARLNRLLHRCIPSNRFVTFFFGVLDPAHHTLTYVNAGHNPPCLVGGAGSAKRLAAAGRPLGLFDGMSCEAEIVEIGPGDLLLCYSDGVTEGLGTGGEEFGEERLLALAREMRDSKPIEVIARIHAELEKHHAGSSRQDDVTLVVLKRTA